jgi:hypothetical protein
VKVEEYSLMHNYMLLDIVSTAAAIPVFAIFLFAPGYALGWATDILRFRESSVARQALLSLPFSIALSTMMANLLGRVLPSIAVLWIFIILAVAVALSMAWKGIQFPKAESSGRMQGTTKLMLFFALLWVLVVIGSVIDVQVGQRLYVSTMLVDHAIRIAFINSAIRSGVAPVNPFCYLGHAPIARYYYFWYVLCSYPARLTHLNPRYILYASSVWAGISLAAIIPLYLQEFLGVSKNLRRKTVFGVALLAVTGLDIIPTLYEFLRARFIYPDMEWWDPVQITSWTDALLWVPHHVASLIACLIGFLVLWSVRRRQDGNIATMGDRVIAGIFAALAFSAGAGLSVYVTFGFALFLVCWGIRLICTKNLSDSFLYLVTGCLTVLFSVPYLHDLMPTASSSATVHASTGGFIAFGLRALPNFLSTPYALKSRGFSHPQLLAPFGTIVVYILEFGIFAIIAWERFRRDVRRSSKLSEAEIASWYLVAVGMFVITFIRSSVISSNDLAFRSAMIVQFVLLLWGAEYLDDWYLSTTWNRGMWINSKNILICFALSLGLASSIYSLAILRTYTVLDDAGMIPKPDNRFPPAHEIGVDLFHARQAYAQLDELLPPDLITQYNPMTADYLPLLEYDKFQSVDAFPNCGTDFGGDASKCFPVQQAIAALFNTPGTYNVQQLCAKLSINVLVARRTDPAWKDPTSWVWSNSPIVANPYLRAFRCR